MARIGKLTALEVTKAKGPGSCMMAVACTSALPLLAQEAGCSYSSSRVSVATWGSALYPEISLAEARSRATERRK